VEDGELAEIDMYDTCKSGWLVAFCGSFYRVGTKQRLLKGPKGGMVYNLLEQY